MSIVKKILFVLLIVNLFMFMADFNNTFAVSLSDMEKNADAFISAGGNSVGDLREVTEAVTTNFAGLGQILTLVGAGVLVAVISYMGIMYLISPPDKQAALKQQLIGVVVAGIVIFGAYGIWSAVIKIVSRF